MVAFAIIEDHNSYGKDKQKGNFQTFLDVFGEDKWSKNFLSKSEENNNTNFHENEKNKD